MIQCLPRGICSWGYLISGGGHKGGTEFNTWSERGSLSADGHHFQVVKGGWLSGEWTLTDGTEVVARAIKTSPFTRSFELSTPDGALSLKAVSPFGRAMYLSGRGTDCEISPDHAFTRRATIRGDAGDFRITVFAFWLTAMVWRRAANNSSNGGS